MRKFSEEELNLLEEFNESANSWIIVSFRYYLGRSTSATSLFISSLRKVMLSLEDWSRNQIKRDLKQRLDSSERLSFRDEWKDIHDIIVLYNDDSYCNECQMIYYNCLCSHDD